MANTKMTKRNWYEVLTAIVEASNYEDIEGAKAFIAHEVDLLDRKSSKSGETKTQKENKAVIAQIETALRTVGRPVTITELQNEVEEMAQYSNQKVSALLRQMPNVVKTTEKKKSYFSIAE